jgi:LPXTG-motif cell wall-anchored protein
MLISGKKTKKTIAAVLAVILVFLITITVALAATQTVFSENFESTNTFTPRADKFDGTYQICEVFDASTVTYESRNSMVYKMRLGNSTQSSAGHNWLETNAGLTSSIPSNATSVRVSADMFMKEPSTNNLALITADDGFAGMVTYVMGQKMRVRFNYSDMNVYYGTDNNQPETLISSFSFDTWYSIVFEFNATTKKCDFYLNGTLMASALDTLTKVDAAITPCPLVKFNVIVDSTTADINGMMMLFDNVLVAADYPDPTPSPVASEDVPKTGDNNSFGLMAIALVLSLAVLGGAVYLWNSRRQAE